jgi:hypothetical protein
VFDDRGNVTEQAYFGVDGKPALHPDGYHRVTRVFDDSGNLTEETHFDVDGKRLLLPDGRRIAFRSERDGDFDIYIYVTDTENFAPHQQCRPGRQTCLVA